MLSTRYRLALLYVAATLSLAGCGGSGSGSKAVYVRILPGQGAGAASVSGDGRVASGADFFASLNTKGIAWKDGVPFQIDETPEATFMSGIAVNQDGSVIVGTAQSTSNPGASLGIVPFIWKSGVGGQIIPLPSEYYSASARGVSADGALIVGSYSPNSEASEAYRWMNGATTILPHLDGENFAVANAISSNGIVTVGYSGRNAVSWIGTSLPEKIASTAQALDVSRNGSVIVGVDASSPGGFEQAFRWTSEGGATKLGILPGWNQSKAVAVDDSGAIVVGNCYDGSGPAATEPFIWSPASGMRRLRDVLMGSRYAALLALPSLALRDISKDGKTIVGTSYDNTTITYTAWSARLP